MKRQPDPLALVACCAVLVGLLSPAAISQPVVKIEDPPWQKTTNWLVEGPAMGTTSKSIGDAYWQWTAVVWDGPQQNGFGVTIPGWVPGDFWAYWLHRGGVTNRWFHTSVEVCHAGILSDVRLVNKYCPGCPAGEQRLGINDDLYVWVNGQPAAAGGTAASAGRLGNVVEPFRSLFVSPARTGVVETDGWNLPDGLQLLTHLFVTGTNEIWVLTDEFAVWGGLSHPVFKITQSGPCEIIIEIDIKPGSYPNCFNINGHGVVPVAILGSAEFDVWEIDMATLDFSGLEVRVKGNGDQQCHYEDVNADGYTDLVCQFLDDDPLSWQGGTSDADVTGSLLDGRLFRGTDEICIVP